MFRSFSGAEFSAQFGSKKGGLAAAAFALLAVLPCPSRAEPHSNRVVCFIGGLNSEYGRRPGVIRAITETFGGSGIRLIELKIGDGTPAATRQGMYAIVQQVYDYARSLPELTGKRVTIIGSSQGGLVTMALIAMHRHELPFTVDSAITIASPLAGEYGLPDFWAGMLDGLVHEVGKNFTDPIRDALLAAQADPGVARALSSMQKKFGSSDPFTRLRRGIAEILKYEVERDFGLLRLAFYNPVGQSHVSTAGYWHDPLHLDQYFKYCTFLPRIMNEVDHPDAARYAKNIGALNLLVFLSAERDEVLKPVYTAERRFYKKGSKTEVEASFKDTRTYRENLLTLGTMFDEGRLKIEEMSGAPHDCWSEHCWQALIRYFRMILEREKS
ncbi:MAG: hypothetical protein M1549_00265 [Candidatus Dependentiae bacterium]|nr:hypothetical protein [Candidatus Dependentiae bacterium]